MLTAAEVLRNRLGVVTRDRVLIPQYNPIKGEFEVSVRSRANVAKQIGGLIPMSQINGAEVESYFAAWPRVMSDGSLVA